MKNFLYFLCGAIVGSGATYFIVKERCKRQADEEIASVVETFNKRRKELEENSKQKIPTDPWNNEKKENKEIIDDSKYTIGIDTANENTNDKTVVIENNNEKILPYIITEDEYGEFGNEEETLLYYADKVLADEEDNRIEDTINTIGDTLDEFDDPYCERIYVRDESKEIDYTILRSDKLYSEVINGEV